MFDLTAYLPAEIGVPLFVALLAASFGTSFMTASLGIGGGALLLAILASIMPPVALIPVHGVVQLGSNAVRAGLLLRSVKWWVVPGFLLGSLAGAALGGLVVVDLPPATIQILVGIFIIWTVVSSPPKWLRRWPVLTGGFSSFLTMFVGATGPFVASYVKSLGLERFAHVGTHAVLMTVQHLLKVLVFGFLGFAFGAWLPVMIGMVLSGAAGTYAGRLMLSRMTDVHFHRALTILLVLISLKLIWSGASTLWEDAAV